MKWFPKFLFGLSGLLAHLPITGAQKATAADANRELGEKFVATINRQEYDALVGFFTSPNATYWVNGDPARVSSAGTKTVAERFGGYGDFLGSFERFSLTLTDIVADEDGVMLEARGRGEGPGTFLYLQTAVMSFRVKDGKFDSMKEYLDHQEVQYLLTYLGRWPQIRPAAS